METSTIQNAERAAREQIGTCEICGATDHHLVDGVCPACRPRVDGWINFANVKGFTPYTLTFFDELMCPSPPPVRVHSDEELEFWGEYFTRHELREQGNLFEIFLSAPHAIAQAMILRRMNEPPARRHVRATSRPLFDADLVFLRRQAD